eukprot:jgi/Undpi1/9930/HiC_scaffold_28.g12384.m1
MNAIRASRPRAVVNVAVARFATTNSRGRTVVRDPRKAKRRPRASTAVEQVPEQSPSQVSQPFLQQDPPPQSFAGSMVQSMTWGMGMVFAFTAVGMFFR